jgi:hypothetical protein
MKVKILSLPLLLGFLFLFSQCEKDTLDPLEDDHNGSKKTIIAANDDGSSDESDDGSNDETDDGSSDETDDGSSDETDDGSNDDADDGSNDDADDGSNDEGDDEANDETDDEAKDGTNDGTEDGTEDEAVDEADDEVDDETIDESLVIRDLWAGAGRNDISKGIKAGTVSAEIIAPGIMLVKYETESPWSLSEAHLWVGNSLSELPKNAAPGKFTFKQELDDTYSAEFEVNLDLLGIDYPNDPIYMAAHAVVGNESAWAFGSRTFINLGMAKKWGWVFRF